jgi:cytochrome c556
MSGSDLNTKESKKLKKSKRPYIFIIQKFKDNEKKYLNNEDKNIAIKYSKELSPLSGDEFEYQPEIWNDNPKIKESHNCYSYAMGKIVPGLDSKAQPGYASGFNHIGDNQYDCKYFRERLKKDSPGTYLESFDNACLPGFYKVFLALDPQVDYHWWRQDKSQKWSHKPGSTEVTNVDADNKEIKNPLTSNRNFGSVNYYKPCFFACVYSDLTRTLDTIYNAN